MQLSTLRQTLLDSYRLGVDDGQSKCELRAGKQRIGIIDGSGFGRLLASCFEIVGPVSLMVDLQPYEKRGKELPASYALLRRLKAKLGEGFVNLILGDGLYLNAPFFNLCLDELKSVCIATLITAISNNLDAATSVTGVSDGYLYHAGYYTPSLTI